MDVDEAAVDADTGARRQRTSVRLWPVVRVGLAKPRVRERQQGGACACVQQGEAQGSGGQDEGLGVGQGAAGQAATGQEETENVWDKLDVVLSEGFDSRQAGLGSGSHSPAPRNDKASRPKATSIQTSRRLAAAIVCARARGDGVLIAAVATGITGDPSAEGQGAFPGT